MPWSIGSRGRATGHCWPSCAKAGVWPTARPARRAAGGPLSDQTFVITGTLPNWSRDEAKAFIEAHRRQGHRQRQQENQLPAAGRGARLQAGQGAKPGCADHRRGWVCASLGRASRTTPIHLLTVNMCYILTLGVGDRKGVADGGDLKVDDKISRAYSRVARALRSAESAATYTSTISQSMSW